MKVLLIFNDPPHRTERCHNVLQLANALMKRDPEAETTDLLIANALQAARRAQDMPQ